MIITPKCFERNCIYYLGVKQDNEDEKTERVFCSAYLDGIPDEIAYGDDKHLTVRDDQDNQVTYESNTDE